MQLITLADVKSTLEKIVKDLPDNYQYKDRLAELEDLYSMKISNPFPRYRISNSPACLIGMVLDQFSLLERLVPSEYSHYNRWDIKSLIENTLGPLSDIEFEPQVVKLLELTQWYQDRNTPWRTAISVPFQLHNEDGLSLVQCYSFPW